METTITVQFSTTGNVHHCDLIQTLTGELRNRIGSVSYCMNGGQVMVTDVSVGKLRLGTEHADK